MLRKKQAFRTSPTNRGSSLRIRFGTAFGRCYNPCHSLPIDISPSNSTII
ncbi:MAG: hypothetical protein MR739_05400 [Spirochaetia bacterium]|nr:hypothetical protein [Spirochaetia bacterium]